MTYKPTSQFQSFFLYPFTYPKTEASAKELPEITKDYWKSLTESFKDYDTIKNLPIFVKGIKKAEKSLSLLHKMKDVVNVSVNVSVNSKLLEPEPELKEPELKEPEPELVELKEPEE